MENMNIRIARELNKIARELVAGGEVANQQGEYKNFTGTIDWKGTKGQVKNATFLLKNDRYYIRWEDGIWENGTWKNGAWHNGTWKNGTWKSGRFDHGIWENGTWESGKWYYGTWKNGIWKKGIWDVAGEGNRSRHESPDKWKDFNMPR